VSQVTESHRSSNYLEDSWVAFFSKENVMQKSQKIVLLALLLSGPAYAGTFTNGGFEDGNLTGWTQGGGTWSGSATLPTASAYVGGPSNNTVVGIGKDQITGANTVFNGNHAVRVNDSNPGNGVSTISQSVTNYTEKNIFFEWNAVLQQSHGLSDSDYFSMTLRDDTTGLDIVSRSYSSAGSVGAGTSGVTWTPFSDWFSSGWQTEKFDLAALGAVGHNFTLSMLLSDCPYGAHAGYAYLDGFGSTVIPPGTGNVPVPAAVWLFGSGLVGLLGAKRKSKLTVG
jgi:hypothetical protein